MGKTGGKRCTGKDNPGRRAECAKSRNVVPGRLARPGSVMELESRLDWTRAEIEWEAQGMAIKGRAG